MSLILTDLDKYKDKIKFIQILLINNYEAHHISVQTDIFRGRLISKGNFT
jgi:hypothetical protein